MLHVCKWVMESYVWFPDAPSARGHQSPSVRRQANSLECKVPWSNFDLNCNLAFQPQRMLPRLRAEATSSKTWAGSSFKNQRHYCYRKLGETWLSWLPNDLKACSMRYAWKPHWRILSSEPRSNLVRYSSGVICWSRKCLWTSPDQVASWSKNWWPSERTKLVPIYGILSYG